MSYSFRPTRARLPTLAAAIAAVVSALIVMPAFAGPRVLVSSLENGQQYDQFIVRYRNGSATHRNSATLQKALNRAVGQGLSAQQVSVKRARRLAVGADVIRVNRKLDRAQAESLMRQLADNPDVEYVEPDLKATIARADGPARLADPNDPRYKEQWDLFEPVGGVNIAAAWLKSTGTGAVVGVIDTGIINHPELNAAVLPGYDFISNVDSAGDGDGRDADPADPGDYFTDEAGAFHASSWHGSHVAGTVAARANNNEGIVGMAYNAKILPVRVLGRSGGVSSDIADALVWSSGGTVPGVAINPNPAEVVNLSLGGKSSTCPPTLQAAINSAVMRGTTVVIAAGNANIDVGGFFPANCDNVVAVAATDREGNRTYYSNFGAKIDVSAPGGETRDNVGSGILSSVDTGREGPQGPGYAFYAGTSMASPHVAALVAMMQSTAPSPRTPAQIEALLKQAARKVPGECTGGCGAGIIDPAKSIELAMQNADNTAPVAGFSVSLSSMTAVFTDSSRDSDGSIASRTWDFGDGTSSTETSPTHVYLRDGEYSVLLRVIDNRGGTGTQRKSITIGTPGGTPLQNGVPLTGLSAAEESYRTFRIDVPAQATNLVIKINGGVGARGDAELLVKHGEVPTLASFDCRPKKLGNEETCTFATTKAGTYYVVLYGILKYSGVTLTASYEGGVANKPPMAKFSVSGSGATYAFTNASTDPDGSIAKQAWDFGDGTSSTDANPSHTYAKAGTYTVKLTVTDNIGAQASVSQSLTVDLPQPNELQPGKAVTDLSGDKSSEQFFTMNVPSGARGLSFVTSGGSGDADLFVKFGSRPSDSSFDCRSQAITNNERCVIATPQAGIYHVRIKAYRAYTGLSLMGDYSVGGAIQTYRNDTPVTIIDTQTVESAIAVSGRDGKGLSATEVAVDIRHTYIGDLKVELVAPSGNAYVLHNRSGGSTDNIQRSFSVDLSSEPLNGNWTLRVFDAARGDTGSINQWAVTF